MSLGVMMAGGRVKEAVKRPPRREHDFYPSEEPEIFHALMLAESARLRGCPDVWEPACGAGDGAKVIERFGKRVIGTDLIYRGYGRGGVDFLQVKHPLSQRIITNSPYGPLAEQFIRHALGVLRVNYMALLLKAQYFHTQGRVKLWNEFTPARELKLCWRPDFTHEGGGPMDFTWWVWDRRARRSDGPVVSLLERPWPK